MPVAVGAEGDHATLGLGKTAPVRALPSTGDTTLDLASFRGQVVLVNFWASWCAPCLEEMPLLQDLHLRTSGKGLSVMAVNLDRHRMPAQGVIDHLGLSLPVVFDANGDYASLYNPQSLPASFLVGPAGKIHAVYDGVIGPKDVAEIEALAKALLQ